MYSSKNSVFKLHTPTLLHKRETEMSIFIAANN